jgi:hypothetical protein
MMDSATPCPRGLRPMLRLGAAWLSLCASPHGLAAGASVDFNRDIRPILSENCFYCHGPDPKHREAGLRLDVREEALEALSPGKAKSSEVLARIFTEDAEDLMPPPDSHKKLTAAQKQTLQRWVEEGAVYQGHWAFAAASRPPIPKIEVPQGNAIDAFVVERLRAEGGHLSPTADARTLARRLALDLTGLPPAPAMIEAFAANPSPQAYEALVDRLLQSAAYGEHMAAQWLDFARYADSHGFQTDSSRSMWPWRDWVIRAFNRNLPFDQFSVEQLAGDLLPSPSLDQIVATGFHRNHRINGEGGIIDEEWRLENIIDRVDTTGATWLGLTLGCARCHDHKYDPISQREFYQLFAFFNNIEESGVIRGASNRSGGNPDPYVKVPDQAQQLELQQLKAAVKAAEAKVAEEQKQLPALLAQWEPKFIASLAQSRPQWQPLEGEKVRALQGSSLQRLEDGSWLAGGRNPNHDTYVIEVPIQAGGFSGLALDILPHPSLPGGSVGRHGNGNFVLTRVEAEIHAPSLKQPQVVEFSSAEAIYSQRGWGVESLIPQAKTKARKGRKQAASNRGKGWAVDGNSRRESNRAMLLTDKVVGVPEQATLHLRLVHETLGAHQIGRFKLSLTSEPPDQVNLQGDGRAPAEIRAIATKAAAKRSPAERNKLSAFFRSSQDSPLRRADQALQRASAALESFEMKLPSVMVMRELPKPREARILLRGEYDKPGDVVTAATPAALPPLPADAPRNRLGLARWITSPQHPLTARVWVNRQWERFFGKGLVKSSENFGVQSEPPSHPQLLDWLATEFMQGGWDMKRLQKLIVMSATYRQQSSMGQLSDEWLARDPENRLLARAPRLRLSAEAIRDQALQISGLLDPRLGGASVRPYMPDGIWDETSRYGDLRGYKPDSNGGLYRRTLYTIWKRTAAPPTMLLFDSPSRETCTVKRSRTNTPLQALALLNEITYVEAARVLAQRMMQEGGKSPQQRLNWAFTQVTGRQAQADEIAVLLSGLNRHLQRFRAAPEQARALVAQGQAKVPADLDPVELAAFSASANVLLNLDEVVTRD